MVRIICAASVTYLNDYNFRTDSNMQHGNAFLLAYDESNQRNTEGNDGLSIAKELQRAAIGTMWSNGVHRSVD